jgi:hypothetical protein
MAKGFGSNIQTTSTRVAKLKRLIKDIKDPEIIMMHILEVFKESEFIPDVGSYYTFVYLPKTPDITYDEHPLVAVTAVERWGFRAINFHWGQSRNYTWIEVVGKMHTIYPNEIEYMRLLSYAKFVTK